MRRTDWGPENVSCVIRLSPPTRGMFRKALCYSKPKRLNGRIETDWIQRVKEGIVSEKNGDKSRFGQERQRKILRRKRVRELRMRLDLENKTTGQPTPTTGEEKRAAYAHRSRSN